MCPYANQPIENWSKVTDELIKNFPLEMKEIVDVVTCSWHRLWKTQIGDEKLSFPLLEIDPPATVVGYILEKLIAKELTLRYPQTWRGGHLDNDKDIVCTTNANFSFEIKSSGQRGVKIFGNRSYGQKLQNENYAKKDKSGYYLTVNFRKDKPNLIRFGWIDAEDWISQKASTGQMASLKKEVYEYKLKELTYPYLMNADLFIIGGISEKTEHELNSQAIYSLHDLMTADSLDEKYRKHKVRALQRYGEILKQL